MSTPSLPLIVFVPAVAVTLMSVWPAGALVGGVAVTVIVVVLPAFTTVLAAFAWDSLVVIVQSDGPVAVADTVWSSAEPLVSVRSNVNGESLGPVRVGESVVSVMSPATSVLALTSRTSVAVREPSFAVTVIRPSATVVSPGTLTSRRAVPALLGDTVTLETTKPPPWSVALQPVGGFVMVRSAVPESGDVIVRSKLAVDPGATAIDGYGVVTANGSAASVAGASPLKKTAAVARAIAGRRTRAIRDVGKGPLLQSVASDGGSLPSARDSRN